jgi:DNA-binding NarL/FixJ family response regulator
MPLSTSVAHINVAVAHADPFIAAGIASILAAKPGMSVKAVDGDDLDVLILDHPQAFERPASHYPPRRMPARLVVSDRDSAWEVRGALEAGVQGYLTRESSPQQLEDAVRSLARGARYLCDRVAGQLAESLVVSRPTERESAVLGLLANGLQNKDIGRRLGISVGTVKTHLRTLFDKLDASNRTAAVAKARSRGFLAAEPMRPAAPLR